jgi:two-component system chemotaxis response regulator CheB
MSGGSQAAPPIGVLVVDDSAVMRQLIADALAADSGIRVLGTAADALIARRKIKELSPDVLTLDVEMPNMNGLDFLEKIMTLRPMPVVMVSTLTQRGTETSLNALAMGAVDVVAKPASSPCEARPDDLDRFRRQLVETVKAAAQARIRGRGAKHPPAAPAARGRGGVGHGIVAIGASTGGVQAIRDILLDLPPDCPPIVATQHMPEHFTTTFAARLDRECRVRVAEAADGMTILPGHAYIAPGNLHLELARAHGHYVCRLKDGPLVSGHRPSVDVLFRSVARAAGADALAINLTGVGRDGAQGLCEIRATGARTIGQSEPSCVVYGMPKAAREVGAVETELALERIAAEIMGGRSARSAGTDNRRDG